MDLSHKTGCLWHRFPLSLFGAPVLPLQNKALVARAHTPTFDLPAFFTTYKLALAFTKHIGATHSSAVVFFFCLRQHPHRRFCMYIFGQPRKTKKKKTDRKNEYPRPEIKSFYRLCDATKEGQHLWMPAHMDAKARHIHFSTNSSDRFLFTAVLPLT